MAVRACTNRDNNGIRIVDADFLKALPLRDYHQIYFSARRFFTALGVVTGDGGLWLQKQCMILARNNNTPVPYWLSLPLWRLGQWIKTNNVIVAEEKKEASGRSLRRQRMQLRQFCH